MAVTKVLSGHRSPETAFVVDDYPYGFTLRCKIRYWLERNKNGTRFWSQTTNPKRPGHPWNKPKASTYSPVGAMFLDENGHCQWDGLSIYQAEKARDFLTTYAEGLTDEEIGLLQRLAEAVDRRRAAQAQTQPEAGGAS